MNTVALPDGCKLPSIGLGTWRLGESARSHSAEVAAVRLAIEIGYRVIDTAEMYGEGGAETVVGEALAQALHDRVVTRDELCIVTKVYPHNASRDGISAACARSSVRLGLECIDLYLLHWPGPHPLSETIGGFEALRDSGRIRHWGVSNFDARAMRDLEKTTGGRRCAVNQVYYSPSARGIEFDLLPWQRERSIPLMAYCPLDQGGLADEAVLVETGKRLGASASQVALAWLMGQAGVMVIPKAVREQHLRENFAAASLSLSAADLTSIGQRFAAPHRATPLAMR